MSDEEGKRLAGEYETCAKIADRPFCPVLVSCSHRPTLISRCLKDGRKTWTGRPKDATILVEDGLSHKLATGVPYQFPKKRTALIDTYKVTAATAARAVWDFVWDNESVFTTENDADDASDDDWIKITTGQKVDKADEEDKEIAGGEYVVV
jgi:hypothetical protein